MELFSFKEFEKGEESDELMEDLPKIGVKHFSFVVDDIEKARQMVLKKELAREVEIKDRITGVRYFFIKDPDGMFVEVLKD